MRTSRPSLNRVPAMLGCLVLLAAACGGEPEPSPTTQPEPDGDVPASEQGPDPEPSLRLVAKLAPIADLVEMVGGEHVEVGSLVPPGADSHTYEPRPSDVATLSDADAFLGIGLDLNPGAVALAREHLPEEDVVLLGERYLSEQDLVFDHVHDGDDGHSHGDHGHSHGDDGHAHDGHSHDGDDGHSHGDDGHSHGDAQSHDDGHSHDGDGHSHDEDDGHSHDEAGPNPHVWTGLGNAAVLVDGIADTLSELDPEHAEDYREAATDARGRIDELDERIAAAAATIPEDNRTLVVYHDAWSYFAHDYGLEMVTAVQPSDYAEPSAGEVRDIIDLVREHDVPALFGSEVFPSDVLETIGDEAGATYVGDLADDVLPGEPGDPEHSYLGLMRSNAVLVVDHLGGETDALNE